MFFKYVLIDNKKNIVYNCGTLGDLAKILKTNRSLVDARIKSVSKRPPRSKIVDWNRYKIVKLKHKKLNRPYFRTIRPGNMKSQFKRYYNHVIKEFKKKYNC